MTISNLYRFIDPFLKLRLWGGKKAGYLSKVKRENKIEREFQVVERKNFHQKLSID